MDFLTTQTGYEFVYRKGVLNTGEKVTLELKEATAEQVLDALLKSRGYDYEIVDQVVVIRKGRLCMRLKFLGMFGCCKGR